MSVVPGTSSGCLQIRCEIELYFQMVCASLKRVRGHNGQGIGTFVHGVDFVDCDAEL